MRIETFLRRVGLCALLCLIPWEAIASHPEPGQAAGEEGPATLSLQTVSGETQSLEDYQGRIVVLNFWATWCVPCREEMPLLARIRSEYQARGVEIIGASADEQSAGDQVQAFIDEHGIRFPIWLGATIAHMDRLGLGHVLPATALIDRDGRIVSRILGVVEEKELRERIDWLLGDRSAAPPPALIDHLEPAEHGHHSGEEEHQHGGVGMEGASLVPS